MTRTKTTKAGEQTMQDMSWMLQKKTNKKQKTREGKA